jgi:hypothetical protein
MKAVSVLSVLGVTGLLAGCTGQDGVSSALPSSETHCSDQALDSFLGNKASTETGAALLKASGARSLRWVPPRSAVTMDLRPDRLTVAYNDSMTIVSARCG